MTTHLDTNPGNPPELDATADGSPVLPPENRPTQSTTLRSLTTNTVLGAIGLLFIAPMLWLLLASVDSHASWGIEWPHFSLINFKHVLTGSLLHSLFNSVILAVISTAIASIAGVFAAYSFSRRKIPFKGPLLLFILFSSGVPLTIMVIPVYEIFARFGFFEPLPHGGVPVGHLVAVRGLSHEELHRRRPD
jgi:ABC-type glycerol-3-phosphate transport system permease component